MIQVQADTFDGLARSDQLYPKLIEFLSDNGIKKSLREGALPCFEREYQKNGIWYKEVFVQCESTPDAENYNLIEKGI